MLVWRAMTMEPWAPLGTLLGRLGSVLGPSWTILEHRVKMMLRTLQFIQDVPSEIAFFIHSIKYTKISACPLLEGVSSETLNFVTSDVAKTSFLLGCLKRNRYF